MTASIRSTARLHWYDRGWGLALPLFESTRECGGLRPGTARASRSLAEVMGSAMPTGAALRRRRSTVQLGARRGIDPQTLRTVVGQADHIRQQDRASGDGLSGLQLFVVLYDDRVPDLPSGVYEVTSWQEWHSVREIPGRELRRLMHPILMGQGAPDGAAATMVLVLDVATQQHLIPGDRGLIDAYIDTGRLAQRLVLSATAEGLRTHQTPAVRDPLIEQLLDVRAVDAHVIYTISVG